MMAAKQVKKIVNTLSCPICYKLFKKPKYLPCHHSYCEQCLEKMKEESRITCPQCREVAIVPAGGVNKFSNAFIINHMVDQLVLKCSLENEPEVKCDECFTDKPIGAFCPECSFFLCHGCSEYHKYGERLQSHHLVLLTESSKPLVVSTAAPDRQRCQAIDVPKSSIIGKKVEFTMITRDNNGDCCFREGDQVSIQLEGVNNTTLVSDNNDGVYVASIVAHKVGEVKVSVCVNGEHIKGSPYSVVVGHNYTSLSKPSKTLGIGSGRDVVVGGIAFSRSGVWAVTDLQKECVYLYDGGDQLIRIINSSENSTCQFQFCCISLTTFGDEDHLYVADCYRVQKFTINGDYLLQFGSDNDEIKYFHGLTVHNGKVYATNSDQYISVFLTDGTFYQTIRREQVGIIYDRTFARSVRGLAHDVAVTSNDELLVVDYIHNSIHKFTLDGDYIGKFTQFDGLSNPRCIAIDPHGFVFLTCMNQQNAIVIFDKDGNFVHSFGVSDGSVVRNSN